MPINGYAAIFSGFVTLVCYHIFGWHWITIVNLVSCFLNIGIVWLDHGQ